MAFKAALLLSLNLLFFTVVSSTDVACPPPPCVPCSLPPSSSPPSSIPPSSSPPSSTPPSASPPCSTPPPSSTPPYATPPTSSSPPSTTPPSSSPPSSTPPSASPPSSQQSSCPKDILKFGVCTDLLGLVNVQLGNPSKTPCCSLIQGLANLDAAVCLCTALKANVLGINLNIPIDLSLILKYCGKEAPKGFMCN